jgi:hypothetical protein
VDGALVRWLIEVPLHWLGLVDTAAGCFRVTALGAAFLGQAGWDEPDTAGAPLAIRADGTLHAIAATPAYDRFQLARISDWEPLDGEAYHYRLTPASLARAVRKGIELPRIIEFIERAGGGAEALNAAPDWALLRAALHRWEQNGPEAALSDTVVLRLSSVELLETLRRHASVRDYLGEALGPTAVAVRREHIPALRSAMAALGVLLDGG